MLSPKHSLGSGIKLGRKSIERGGATEGMVVKPLKKSALTINCLDNRCCSKGSRRPENGTLNHKPDNSRP